MRVTAVLLALLLVSAAQAHAQTVAVPNQVEALVIAPGADASVAAPIAAQTSNISAIDTTSCGFTSEPAPGPTPLVNPTRIYFADPFTAGRFCKTAMPSGIPPGQSYQAVLRFIAPSCTVNNSTVTPCPSPRSAVGAPLFNIIAIIDPPTAPQNLHVRP